MIMRVKFQENWAVFWSPVSASVFFFLLMESTTVKWEKNAFSWTELGLWYDLFFQLRIAMVRAFEVSYVLLYPMASVDTTQQVAVYELLTLSVNLSPLFLSSTWTYTPAEKKPFTDAVKPGTSMISLLVYVWDHVTLRSGTSIEAVTVTGLSHLLTWWAIMPIY